MSCVDYLRIGFQNRNLIIQWQLSQNAVLFLKTRTSTWNQRAECCRLNWSSQFFFVHLRILDINSKNIVYDPLEMISYYPIRQVDSIKSDTLRDTINKKQTDWKTSYPQSQKERWNNMSSSWIIHKSFCFIVEGTTIGKIKKKVD